MSFYFRSGHALLLAVSAIALEAAIAPAQAQTGLVLDPITVLATKTEEKSIDALAPISSVRQGQIDQIMPNRTSDIFFGVPGVSFQQRPDEPATSINIRGLQDFGRVNVVVDGARQNFQRSGHNANGAFYLDPEMIADADVVRGPVANIFGSGAIGGVVSFRTKDADDIIKPGQRWGIITHGEIGSNKQQYLASIMAASRVGQNVDIVGGFSWREQDDFKAGSGGSQPSGALFGPGDTVDHSANEAKSGLGKLTFRPADGHEVKISALSYQSDYTAGQPNNGDSIFATTAKSNTVSGKWRYSRPDDKLFDFDANVYWTETNNEQTKICCTSSAITGALGATRKFGIDTTGFDVNNTTRFDLGPIANALTYGGDAFFDKVQVDDPTGTGALFTPNGKRDVSGGFAQWKANYSTWLEVIGAARYDTYKLSGGGFESEGDRVSPKGTVGITPINGFTVYGTYAEGYRAPAVTESLIAGLHPFPANFTFLPNPELKPEVGKTTEGGINLKYDGIFTKNDKFRGKFNVFRNNVENYIDLAFIPFIGGPPPCTVPPFCFQYQNVANAKIEGVEFETMYDTGDWFAGLSGHRIRGKDEDTGIPLLSIPADQIATTFGIRVFDRKVSASVRWAAVAAKTANDIPSGAIPTGSYNLVNVYLGYQPTEDVLAAVSVENLLNKYYFDYLDAQSSRVPERGLAVKGSLKVRFGS